MNYLLFFAIVCMLLVGINTIQWCITCYAIWLKPSISKYLKFNWLDYSMLVAIPFLLTYWLGR